MRPVTIGRAQEMMRCPRRNPESNEKRMTKSGARNRVRPGKPSLAASRVTNPTWQNALKRSCGLSSAVILVDSGPVVPAGAANDPHHRVRRVARLCNRGTAHACRSPGRRRYIATAALRSSRPSGGCSLIVTRARPRRCSPADLGSAETTNRRESLCLNAYLMNHWSRSSIRVCLAGVASTVGCRAEMTMSSRWRPSVTEWPQAWRITRLTTCRPRQTLRRQEFPKQSIWRSEGCWATPQSTRRTADFARENLTRQPSVPTGQARVN
jgi:hypothetical protein